MGIRFYCPNGHKLNVKEFQAGRKGICPFCGAKLQIPTESTRPSSRDEQQQTPASGQAAGPIISAGDTVGDDSQGSMPSLTAPTMPPVGSPPSQSAAGPAVPMVSAPMVSAPLVSAPMRSMPTVAPVATASVNAAPMAMPPTAPAEPAAPPLPAVETVPASSAADPLSEAGDVVWYVRPPSGGQFGPAGSDVMRSWLGEGRISADSLVWREGWRDWQEAGGMFPQLRAEPPAAASSPAISQAAPQAPLVAAVVPHAAHPKPRGFRVQDMVVVGLLIVAVAILLAVFVAVLYWGHSPS
jgi:hypothetical protein